MSCGWPGDWWAGLTGPPDDGDDGNGGSGPWDDWAEIGADRRARAALEMDDCTATLVAAVEACWREDLAAVKVLLRGTDHDQLLARAIKLLAEGICAGCVESGDFAAWAARAVNR